MQTKDTQEVENTTAVETTAMTNDNVHSEDGYIGKLSDIAKSSAGLTNFDLVLPEDKTALENKEKELKDYLTATVLTDINKDEAVEGAIELWNQYKDLVKNGKASFALNNLEIRTVDKKLHTSVDYDTETLFYGLHLKKHFIDTLPNPKGSDFQVHDISITFSNAIALYHVLSTIKVRGLNKENYAFAHLLFKLSEISKVYQYYDGISLRLNQTIGQWTMGLTPQDSDKLNASIKDTVVKDLTENKQ